jgi:hypothetical protein
MCVGAIVAKHRNDRSREALQIRLPFIVRRASGGGLPWWIFRRSDVLSLRANGAAQEKWAPGTRFFCVLEYFSGCRGVCAFSGPAYRGVLRAPLSLRHHEKCSKAFFRLLQRHALSGSACGARFAIETCSANVKNA